MKKIISLTTATAVIFGFSTTFAWASETQAESNSVAINTQSSGAYSTRTNHEILTGVAKEVYEQLKPLVKEIADGKRTKTDELHIQCSANIVYDDIRKAVAFLTSDAPELVYWCRVEAGAGVNTKITGQECWISIPVSYNYYDGESLGDFYTVVPEKQSVAGKALNNAKSIADKYAEYPDYEKVYGYAYEISLLTGYEFDYTSK
ncbi:MAG: hypothetical protein NC452_20580, partial [Eubacterium sp.]|nr:hypothetical protein [Eubacterium sp.]